MEKLTIKQICEEIKFIEKNDVIEEVYGGFSEAYTYKIQKADKTYFLKLLKNRENAIQRLLEILEIYKQSDIDTVTLVDCGILEKHNQYYCIYDWINGNKLSDFVEEKDFDYFYEIGKKVGKKLKSLKQLKKEPKYINKSGNLLEEIKKWFASLETVPDDIVYCHFNKKEVEDIKQKMIDYARYFRKEDKCFVHTDIKMGNIMLEKEKVYIVDIEDMAYDYDVFNIICWPIGVFQDTPKGKYDRFFQKGIFEGFHLQRPDLEKQILFLYMAKFCFSTYTKYRRKQEIDSLKLYKIAYDKTNQFTKLKEDIFK